MQLLLIRGLRVLRALGRHNVLRILRLRLQPLLQLGYHQVLLLDDPEQSDHFLLLLDVLLLQRLVLLGRPGHELAGRLHGLDYLLLRLLQDGPLDGEAVQVEVNDIGHLLVLACLQVPNRLGIDSVQMISLRPSHHAKFKNIVQ